MEKSTYRNDTICTSIRGYRFEYAGSTSNLHYYNSQFIIVASDTVLTRRCFAATMNRRTDITDHKVALT